MSGTCPVADFHNNYMGYSAGKLSDSNCFREKPVNRSQLLEPVLPLKHFRSRSFDFSLPSTHSFDFSLPLCSKAQSSEPTITSESVFAHRVNQDSSDATIHTKASGSYADSSRRISLEHGVHPQTQQQDMETTESSKWLEAESTVLEHPFESSRTSHDSVKPGKEAMSHGSNPGAKIAIESSCKSESFTLHGRGRTNDLELGLEDPNYFDRTTVETDRLEAEAMLKSILTHFVYLKYFEKAKTTHERVKLLAKLCAEFDSSHQSFQVMNDFKFSEAISGSNEEDNPQSMRPGAMEPHGE